MARCCLGRGGAYGNRADSSGWSIPATGSVLGLASAAAAGTVAAEAFKPDAGIGALVVVLGLETIHAHRCDQRGPSTAVDNGIAHLAGSKSLAAPQATVWFPIHPEYPFGRFENGHLCPSRAPESSTAVSNAMVLSRPVRAKGRQSRRAGPKRQLVEQGVAVDFFRPRRDVPVRQEVPLVVL